MKLFTNKEIWIWILASLLVINLAITATILWRQNAYDLKPPPPPGMRMKPADDKPHEGFGKWHEKMGFTEEQSRKLKALRDEFRTNSDAILNLLNENQHKIYLELDSDEPKLFKLDSLITETGNIHSRMRKESVEHMLKIREITTPEQYDQMLDMMKDWMFRGPGMHPQQRKHRNGKPLLKDTCNSERQEK